MNSSLIRSTVLMLAWGLAASFAGYFQLLAHVSPRFAPVLIASLTVLFSVAVRRVAWLRETVSLVGLRGVIATHILRFLGIVFLWYHAQGRLPEEFAMRAGWGDVATAIGAIVLVFWPAGKGFERALFAWNVFGALDLFVAVGTAGWLNLIHPGAMSEIARFPLTLVPLWLVPVMLTTHFLMLTGGIRPEQGASSRDKFLRREVVT